MRFLARERPNRLWLPCPCLCSRCGSRPVRQRSRRAELPSRPEADETFDPYSGKKGTREPKNKAPRSKARTHAHARRTSTRLRHRDGKIDCVGCICARIDASCAPSRMQTHGSASACAGALAAARTVGDVQGRTLNRRRISGAIAADFLRLAAAWCFVRPTSARGYERRLRLGRVRPDSEGCMRRTRFGVSNSTTRSVIGPPPLAALLVGASGSGGLRTIELPVGKVDCSVHPGEA